ncbi:CML12 [Symbiodinium sp. CCMP2592]|nr:CML12 [Symbiodinium sp. CCMP2592]
MELDLFAEVLCDADPALLLGGAAGAGGAHDFGRAGRAVAWLADVGSAIFQTGSKKRQGPAGAGTEPSDRLAQLQPALKLVADLLEASPESKGSTLVAAALDALREGELRVLELLAFRENSLCGHCEPHKQDATSLHRSSTEPAAFRWIDVFKFTCSNAALANVWLPETVLTILSR